MKSCSCCGTFKPLADYDHSRSSRDGHHHRCKTCDRKRDRQRRADGSLARAYQRWQSFHPQAVATHRAFRAAVKRGEIMRQPCELCGDPRSHGHHDDYSKPLEVSWLCQLCHIEHHRLERLYGKGQKLFSFMGEGSL